MTFCNMITLNLLFNICNTSKSCGRISTFIRLYRLNAKNVKKSFRVGVVALEVRATELTKKFKFCRHFDDEYIYCSAYSAVTRFIHYICDSPRIQCLHIQAGQLNALDVDLQSLPPSPLRLK